MENGISNFNAIKTFLMSLFSRIIRMGRLATAAVLFRLTKRNHELKYVSCLPRCCCCFNDIENKTFEGSIYQSMCAKQKDLKKFWCSISPTFETLNSIRLKFVHEPFVKRRFSFCVYKKVGHKCWWNWPLALFFSVRITKSLLKQRKIYSIGSKKS